EPHERVFLNQLVAAAVAEAVQLEIAAGPIQVRARRVYRDGRARAARGRVHGRGTRSCEQIQEALAGREAAQPSAREPVVERQTRAAVVGEAHEEAQAALLHFVKLARRRGLALRRVAHARTPWAQ